MRLRTALLSAVVAAASVSGLVASADAATAPKATPLPTHVFAPYFETYQEGQSPSAMAKQAGVKYLTFAFLQTATTTTDNPPPVISYAPAAKYVPNLHHCFAGRPGGSIELLRSGCVQGP